MILPTKHLPQERALLTVGARLLASLDRPKTISALWNEMQRSPQEVPTLGFDWFVLAVDLLYILGAVQLRDGVLVRNAAPTTGDAA